MKQFMKVVFASMVGTCVALGFMFFVVVAIIAASAGSNSSEWEADLGTVKENSVLKIVFDGPLKDHVEKRDIFSSLMSYDDPPVSGLYELTQVLKQAASDDQIKGLFLHFKSFGSGLANAEALRREVAQFKSSGKFVIAYAEVYSEMAYLVASVADEVVLYPKGFFEWDGLFAKRMYFKNTLKKLDVVPQIFRVGKYKSAIEPFITEKMSEASREQTDAILKTAWDQLTLYAQEKTNLSVEELDGLAEDMSVVFAKDAIDKGFVSLLASFEEVEDKLVELSGASDKPNYAGWRMYFKNTVQADKKTTGDKVALVFASGNIVTSGDDDQIASDDLAKLLNKIRREDNVKAVVIRVNSPGGSSLASDVIWTSTNWLKEAKPVVTSFGNVAASGGYYMSAGSQYIFAEPTTITGSIGVFGVTFATKKFFNDRLGVNFDTVKSHKYSDLESLVRPFEAEEGLKIQNVVNTIYDDFLKVVTDGREALQDRAQTHEIAQGRVWTGLAAKEIGLVDEIGGMEQAIAKAAEIAGLSDYSVDVYPKELSAFEEFVKQFGGVSHKIIKAWIPQPLQKVFARDQKNLSDKVFTRMPFDIEIR